MLKMLSGCVSAVARAFSRGADWTEADRDELNEAIQAMMEREYGWHTKWGGLSGMLYHRKNGNLAGAGPGSFYPSFSWDDTMKAVKECVEGGMRVDLRLRPGRCSPRHMCVRLLTMCGVERPVPEIMCEGCGKTARQFKKDAKADGWLHLYHSHLWTQGKKKFPVNGWGFLGRCASCGPRKRRDW